MKSETPTDISFEKFYLHHDGQFPNSPLPVILYREVLDLAKLFSTSKIIHLFKSHHWSNAWQGGIYTYAHYHSITHEVLGFYKGTALLQLGGKKGVQVTVNKGDVLIIPAGVAHKNLNSENDVGCVGAYPDGRDFDINRGLSGERPATDKNIATVPVPGYDPVFGGNGALHSLWNSDNETHIKNITYEKQIT